MADKIKKNQLLLDRVGSSLVDFLNRTTDQVINKMIAVRIAVARSASIFFKPAFAKIAVRAANKADSSAKYTHGETVNIFRNYPRKVNVNYRSMQTEIPLFSFVVDDDCREDGVINI